MKKLCEETDRQILRNLDLMTVLIIVTAVIGLGALAYFGAQ